MVLDKILTEQIFAYIASELAAKGRPPTLRELADNFFVSTGTIQRHLDWLEMHGRIERQPGKARSIRILT